MPTFYKPAKWRGKRIVYQSIDPAESKSAAKQNVAVLIAMLIILLVGVFGVISK